MMDSTKPPGSDSSGNAGQCPVNDGLVPLVPCPMCDSRSGYALKDGSTYRWWDVFCVNCGRTVDECASDRRTQLGTELPDRWPAADAAWNAAGAHAESLRTSAAVATEIAAQYGADRDMLRDALAASDALGLKRLELYAHPEDWPAIKALAEKLQRRRTTTRGQKMRNAGFTRRPSAKSLPSDE